jgi:hypothetical protein
MDNKTINIIKNSPNPYMEFLLQKTSLSIMNGRNAAISTPVQKNIQESHHKPENLEVKTEDKSESEDNSMFNLFD